ncbi:MAG: HAD-IC family P-type ATPase [Anaeroplasmataceae bacterium]
MKNKKEEIAASADEVKEDLTLIDNKEEPQESLALEDNKEKTNSRNKKKDAKEKKSLENKNEEILTESKNEEELSEIIEDTENDKRNEKKLKQLQAKHERKAPAVRYDVNPEEGLSKEQVEERILTGYTNRKPNSNSKSIKNIIFTNVFTFFNILMLCIAGWLISIGAIKDLFFMVIVTLNIIIGIVQEIRAKITIDKLSILSCPVANVLRDGNVQEIGVNDIVLDDIMLLESGKQISSDSIVVEGSIEVNESLLTGESDAIVKNPGDKLFSGSFVVSGVCKARVDAVGEDNYIEKLTTQAKRYNKPKSELLISLNLIIRFMAVVIIPIGAILFCMQCDKVLGTLSYSDSVRKTAGAMIGMIPSGLYLLTSIALAVGVMKLAQNNVLVQELYCIEMLARVDCLCLDKTGTITDGTMTVKNVIEYSGIAGLSTKNIVSAMLNATNDQNMTAVALEQKFGRAKRLKSLSVIPFSSQRKYSAASFDKVGTFVMGAPEFVLTKNYNLVAQDVLAGAKQGYRVLLIAHTTEMIKDSKIDTNLLNPVSLILIEDTIRPDAIDTINYFKESGVEVKVISGDNPVTVSKVSQRAGIENASEYISLDGLSDLEVMRVATKYTVFGRVSPAQKKLLVTTLKEAGKTVAMTGDGVNDILALKEADCSISVASGSEAARNVSHLVLLDNNFGSMPKVVAEGRRVINNVAKVSKLFLTKTIFSLLLAIYAINFGGNYPISTNQLFMIDLFCIGIPSFVLVLEPCNVKSTGGFLSNIIKGALPGAIVILFNAMIVLTLSLQLNLDKRDTSTLIVIIATFTCLIVLFQTCKPFNLLKKGMYAGLFIACIFIVIFLPQFLDITPLTSITTYYDKNLSVETIDDVPSIEISKKGYLVIENEYTDINATTVTNKKLALVDGIPYLKIDDKITNHQIEIIPSYTLNYNDGIYSYNINSSLSLGGTKTNVEFISEVETYITSSGDVYVNGYNAKHNILPSVTISKSNTYLVNGIDTEIPATIKSIENVILRDYSVFVSNEPNAKVQEYIDIGYKIDPVNISVYYENSSSYIMVGGIDTSLRYNEIDRSKLSINENLEYLYDDAILVNSDTSLPYKLDVSVEISDDDHYVIDDIYTQYKISGAKNEITITYDDYGLMIINDTKTDYQLSISSTKGGEVSILSLPAMLLMFALCAITTPFMTLLKKIVPWGKQLIEAVQKIIGKM